MLLLALAFTALAVDTSRLPPPADVTVEFTRDIQPILETACLRCHGPERPRNRFRLDNREAALRGGDTGVAIIPGDSANSTLIHFVARLIEDMEMPPEDKGDPLTMEQVALLRAWIDQGVPWDAVERPKIEFSMAPGLRWISVKGDAAKFREVERMKDGWAGGLEHFKLQQRLSDDTSVAVEGRALFGEEDFQVRMSLDRTDVGFVRAGVEHWRVYYDDTGGYYPFFPRPSFDLDRDLRLDVGRAWADFGLTLPNWPRMVLGYEYQFKDGTKSTLQWGAVNGKNIYPGVKQIDEQTHILKFDLAHEWGAWRIEDSARVEFYDAATRRENVGAFTLGPRPDRVVRTREEFQHTQGMNAVRVERRLRDWLLLSGGYLFSRFDGDAGFDQVTLDSAGAPAAGRFWNSRQIVFKRDTHRFSVSGFATPVEAFSVSVAAQSEWTSQEGFGRVNLDEGDPTDPISFVLQPAVIESDIDRNKWSEMATLRFSRIPWTVLFGEARFEQEKIGHFERGTSGGAHDFLRDTDASNDRQEYRAGFTTSPWRAMSLTAHYRKRISDSDYDHRRDISMAGGGYPAFIRAREIETDEGQIKLALRPANWLKAALSYRIVATDYHTVTGPAGMSPGGGVFAGNHDAHVYGAHLTLTPWRRLYLSGTFHYSETRTATAQNNHPSVPAHRGDVYTLSSSASFVLNEKTDLHVSYFFSEADYGRPERAEMVVPGLEYTRHGAAAGVNRKLTDWLTSSWRYAWYRYREPGSGGFNDYTAHGVFATLAVKWP